MAGMFIKDKDIPDIAWNQFILDITNGDLEEIGISTLCNLKNSLYKNNHIHPINETKRNEIRNQVDKLMKNYREVEDNQKIASLIVSHGNYCKLLGTPKWKRVHNVLAYRYANPKPLTVRMIARKLGRGKEETDHDIREGLDNVAKLLCGYLFIVDNEIDKYDAVGLILRNYKLMKISKDIEFDGLLPLEVEEYIYKIRTVSNELYECFENAVYVYDIFCEGYGDLEKRRSDVLHNGYLEGNYTIPELAKKHNCSVSTIQNDMRINTKRIKDLIFDLEDLLNEKH